MFFNIAFMILTFLHCALAYSNEEYHTKIKQQAKDLESLIDRSLARGDPQLKISSINSKGEAVGEAYFKNSDSSLGNAENVIWYWHPEKGFSVIASKNELLDAYGKDHTKPFQCSKILINEAGIVAFSFLVDQKGHNIYPWLWWSLDEGLHLSSEPTSYQLVDKLNDDGYILIIEFLQHPAFRLHIKHIKDNEDLYVYGFDPKLELTPYTYKNGFRLITGLENDLVEMLFKHRSTRVKKVNTFDWGSFVIIDEFSNDLNIKGRGLVTAEFLEKIWPIFWHVNINYEISDGKAKFMVTNINEAFVSQPTEFSDINNKVIFEKDFSN